MDMGVSEQTMEDNDRRSRGARIQTLRRKGDLSSRGAIRGVTKYNLTFRDMIPKEKGISFLVEARKRPMRNLDKVADGGSMERMETRVGSRGPVIEIIRYEEPTTDEEGGQATNNMGMAKMMERCGNSDAGGEGEEEAAYGIWGGERLATQGFGAITPARYRIANRERSAPPPRERAPARDAKNEHPGAGEPELNARRRTATATEAEWRVWIL